MTELILSDITRMGPGFCIIGLEQTAQGFRSVRPLPPVGFAWPITFRHQRGARLRFILSTPPNISRPHVEDRPSSGAIEAAGKESEEKLLACLRDAEIAEKIQDLFGCAMHPSPFGGPAVWVTPEEAVRSICGIPIENLRFKLYPDRARIALTLGSGETLRGLPVVDRYWNEFLEEALGRTQGANRLQRVEQFANRIVRERVLKNSSLFARVGLPRADDEGRCWLMLDSLVPEPQLAWLDAIG
jgi:hypothetical protein